LLPHGVIAPNALPKCPCRKTLWQPAHFSNRAESFQQRGTGLLRSREWRCRSTRDEEFVSRGARTARFTDSGYDIRLRLHESRYKIHYAVRMDVGTIGILSVLMSASQSA